LSEYRRDSLAKCKAKSNVPYWICPINAPKWTFTNHEALFTHIIF